MPRKGCGRWWSGGLESSKGSEIFAGYQILFASKLAPTGKMHSNVGASLLAKRPSLTTQVAGRILLINDCNEYPNFGASASARAVNAFMSSS